MRVPSRHTAHRGTQMCCVALGAPLRGRRLPTPTTCRSLPGAPTPGPGLTCMLTRASPAGALSAGGGTPPCHREPAPLSVVPSGGTADERRPHPGRGHPHGAPPSAARGRPATDGPGSCVQRRGAHLSERGHPMCQALPLQPSHVARPAAVPPGPPRGAPLPLSCDACPAPAHVAPPCCEPPEPGGGGATGGRGPEHAGLQAGRWSMVTRGAMGGLACSLPRGQQKSARGPPRSAGDCPCALSVAASRVRLDQDRLVGVCGAATGQSCINRMLHRGVSRRQAHFRTFQLGSDKARSAQARFLIAPV